MVDHPTMIQKFHEPLGSVPTLHISYHLQEHYNSVRRGDDPLEEGVSPLLNFKIGHDLDQVKSLLKGNTTFDFKKKPKDTGKIKDEVVDYALAILS